MKAKEPVTRKPRRKVAAAGALAGALVVVLVVVLLRPFGSAAPADTASAPAIDAFWSRYVQADGRVVRTDQGGDTVSEGQAYAMLLAVAGGDQARFNLVWGWTRAHLQRPDGLLAYHWVAGRVADTTPATDADLDTAWALALAASRFHQPDDTTQATRMAGAILTQESVPGPGGPVLVAGPWAKGSPATVDPSYFSPLAYAALSSLTGDPRWSQAAAASAAVVGQLTTNPSRLPPDWASLASARATDSAGPGGGPGPRYGLDAARLEVWSATACQAGWRAVAAAGWSVLGPDVAAGDFALSMDLAGHATSTSTNPLMAVADAASAGAAGHPDQARALLARAAAQDASYPTYYGAAWVALGQILVRDGGLGACPVAG